MALLKLFLVTNYLCLTQFHMHSTFSDDCVRCKNILKGA